MFEMFAKIPIVCSSCQYLPSNRDLTVSCQSCHYKRPDIANDVVYQQHVQPFLMVCCTLLPFAYLAGAFYMFKTHALYMEGDDELLEQNLSIAELEALPPHSAEAGGSAHGDCDWSVKTSIGVLGCMICLFGLVSEVLVECLKPALHQLGIPEGFAGLTLIAIIPNTTSFVNAVRFSLENRIRLSVEIGSTIASQVGLLQLPLLSLLLLFLPQPEGKPQFTLVFNLLTVFAIILSTIIHIYVLFAGRANYFEGVALMVVYFIWVFAFYFVPDNVALDQANSSSQIASVDTWSI